MTSRITRCLALTDAQYAALVLSAPSSRDAEHPHLLLYMGRMETAAAAEPETSTKSVPRLARALMYAETGKLW